MAQPKQNCLSCKFAKQTVVRGNVRVKCEILLPPWCQEFWGRIPINHELKCKAHEPKTGVPKRVCLNCDKPILNEHKSMKLGQSQWIHKCCDHPDWTSNYHYNKFGKGKS